MHPVVASNLRSVGYDPISQTLSIEFHNGTYEFSDYFDTPFRFRLFSRRQSIDRRLS
ncbi:KTSC domain-containing protein [Saccharococcus caldoxylosilyticus]|nr:KTSC domain-containing protein [Parageobacillus caldoxylosilyticus]